MNPRFMVARGTGTLPVKYIIICKAFWDLMASGALLFWSSGGSLNRLGVSKPGFDWCVIQDIGNETFFVLMLRYLFCLKKFASLQKARAPKNNKREEIQHGRFDSLAHLSLL